MRNGAQPQLPQQQLNESIARTRALMNQYKTFNNPEMIVNNLLQNNPQLASITALLRQGNNLENIAKNMAVMKGYDINEIIKYKSTWF